MKDKIEHYWRTYQMINDWIKFSDTKASVILSVFGVLYTIVYSNSDKVYQALKSSNTILLFSSICFILSLCSIFFAFRCLNPKLKKAKPKSVLYFGDIYQLANHEVYLTRSDKVFEDEILVTTQLSEQIFINSNIAWDKFKSVAISIRFFFAVIIFLIFSLPIYLFI
jgi:hypothetical protein